MQFLKEMLLRRVLRPVLARVSGTELWGIRVNPVQNWSRNGSQKGPQKGPKGPFWARVLRGEHAETRGILVQDGSHKGSYWSSGLILVLILLLDHSVSGRKSAV